MHALSSRRDLRFGGTWTHRQTLKNDLVYGLLRAAIACSPAVSGALLGSIAYAFAGGAAKRNVRGALDVGDVDAERISRASFRNLGAHLVDVLRALRGKPLASLPILPEALQTLHRAMEEGRGVVFPSAHLGPWERVAATLVRSGVPLVTMVREAYDPRITTLLARLRDLSRVPNIPRGAPGATSRIVRSLKSGAVLGMPMDLKTRAPSVIVPFFGKPAQTVVGPARLALRTGAPIVVGTVEKIDGRLAITATRIPHDPDPVRLTGALNQEIERRIRSTPEEWVWLHPRW